MAWTWFVPYRIVRPSMPTPSNCVAVGGELLRAATVPPASAADVVRVHRSNQRLVRLSSNRSSNLAALVAEGSDDRRRPVGSIRGRSAARITELAAVGRHRQLARQGRAFDAEAVDHSELGCGCGVSQASCPMRAGADRHHAVISPGRSRLLSSATMPPSDPADDRASLRCRRIEETPLGAGLIANGDEWKRELRFVQWPGSGTSDRSVP